MKGTMKAVVKETAEPGAVYRTDWPIPTIGDHEVLVKVKATAICGTDQHIYPWTPWAQNRVKPPMVFGHEFAGDIVEKGAKVTGFELGDRIAGETHIPCNNCGQCHTDNRHICENMKIIGVHVPGSFAEYIGVPQDCLWKLGDLVDYQTGAMLEPMGVAVHGLTETEIKGKNLVIMGCGPIGLMAVNAAKILGAKKVVATDVVPQKMALAAELGADLTVDSSKSQAAEAIFKLLGRGGADVVVDYTGSVAAIKEGFNWLRLGGTFVLVGLPNQEISLDLTTNVIYKEAKIFGVTGRRMYQTWEKCEKILNSGNFFMNKIIGGVYKLEEFEKAFDSLKSGAVGKMLLIPA
ncbi:MAG: alcohol dehydrogenase catalytic domain-containing protein [Deltaproteobacteria bacterium]|jgi:threonine 3-dehydrogenase|nr:alcohol dehydrogenase catalytic domain-containing protein [Deltaproteobacteria bacterium]